MSEEVSFAEINEQRVEWLPERTVMSVLSLTDTPKGSDTGSGGNGTCGLFAEMLRSIGITLPGTSCTGGASGTTNS